MYKKKSKNIKSARNHAEKVNITNEKIKEKALERRKNKKFKINQRKIVDQVEAIKEITEKVEKNNENRKKALDKKNDIKQSQK